MLAAVIALSLGLMPAAGVPQSPDFTGRWRLVEQETSAWRGRSATGAHEEDVVITQTAGRLSVRLEPGDGAWDYEFAIEAPGGGQRSGEAWAVGTWEGSVLVTQGRRTFRTPQGGESHDFVERRSLSADGSRMTLVTRIEMFPKDLVRTSVYERLR